MSPPVPNDSGSYRVPDLGREPLSSGGSVPPNPALGEKSPMTIGLAILAATALGTASVAIYRIGQLEEHSKAQDSKIETLQNERVEVKLQNQRLADTLSTMGDVQRQQLAASERLSLEVRDLRERVMVRR